jgi:threonine dehydratase
VDIYLKLENLQPIRSFKIRGAGNRLLSQEPEALSRGVWTASAGNMAQGVAWVARQLGVPCTAVVPDTAPEAKLAPIRRLGARIEYVARDEFFEVFATRRHPGCDGLFVHAFSDTEVMAGNATIGLEILEDLPSVREVYVPYGGGGLSCGIAAALRGATQKVAVIACEPETAAPLAASLRSGRLTDPVYTPTWIDGAGGPRLYPEMFELARDMLAEAYAVPVAEAAQAVGFLAERACVVAEGAGALSVAAALNHARESPVVCVVSGGNINSEYLSAILAGGMPDLH